MIRRIINTPQCCNHILILTWSYVWCQFSHDCCRNVWLTSMLTAAFRFVTLKLWYTRGWWPILSRASFPVTIVASVHEREKKKSSVRYQESHLFSLMRFYYEVLPSSSKFHSHKNQDFDDLDDISLYCLGEEPIWVRWWLIFRVWKVSRRWRRFFRTPMRRAITHVTPWHPAFECDFRYTEQRQAHWHSRSSNTNKKLKHPLQHKLGTTTSAPIRKTAYKGVHEKKKK